ncbi:hypothetical protein Ssi02_18860 [Sinosporangium siamense]|uniref:Uncharacterized protein n=2 Tax=Sinosporangium siamense TaxID=1367973 RepID=A0A919RF49_9ACTN|nr:hypothetical protein Ssi02_18860 [Sinosporangium siamense]
MAAAAGVALMAFPGAGWAADARSIPMIAVGPVYLDQECVEPAAPEQNSPEHTNPGQLPLNAPEGSPPA